MVRSIRACMCLGFALFVASCVSVGERGSPAENRLDASLLPPAATPDVSPWKRARLVSRNDAVAVFARRGEILAALARVAKNAEPRTDATRFALETRDALTTLLSESLGEADFIEALQSRFVCVEHEDPFVRCTGYATIEASASRSRDAQFRFPLIGDIRASAPDLLTVERRDALSDARVESLAIAWMADAFDWALVETNGTALLRLRDGSSLPVSRVATNGFAWRGIGRAMADLGAIDPGGMTISTIREAARDRPDLAERAAYDNPRFVAFEVCDLNEFPPALPSGRLTADFSCAADPAHYPLGALLFFSSLQGEAALPGAPIRCVQDVGGAIQGRDRFDLYCGGGASALQTAGELHQRARVSMFMLRSACAELGVSLAD